MELQDEVRLRELLECNDMPPKDWDKHSMTIVAPRGVDDGLNINVRFTNKDRSFWVLRVNLLTRKVRCEFVDARGASKRVPWRTLRIPKRGAQEKSNSVSMNS